MRWLEEAGADAVGEMGQVDQGEEVDGLELAVDGGRAANAGGDIEIGAEESRGTRDFDEGSRGSAAATRLRQGAEARFDEVFGLQGFVHGGAEVFVLRRDGIATEQIARFGAGGVDGQALPEAVQDEGVAEIDVDAGAAELEDFFAHRIVGGEIEELIAVIAEILRGGFPGLQAIGADELAGFQIADHEVVAEGVEGIDVQAGAFGGGEAFAQFEIEDEIAEALALLQILRGLREGDPEEGSFG